MQGVILIIFRFFIYVILFFVTIIYFFPKNEAVNFIVKEFSKKEKVDFQITLDNNFLSYYGENGVVFFKDERIASISNVEISPYLFYYNIILDNVKLEGYAGEFFPKNIKNINLSYNIFMPNKITIESNGEFGTLNGYIELFEEKMFLEITPSSLLSKNYSFILSQFKKNGNKYIIENKL